jgi:hypothetical protein
MKKRIADNNEGASLKLAIKVCMTGEVDRLVLELHVPMQNE